MRALILYVNLSRACFPQIVLSKKYGMAEWREDMKALLRKGGCEGEPTCFLIPDTDIVLESFLEVRAHKM